MTNLLKIRKSYELENTKVTLIMENGPRQNYVEAHGCWGQIRAATRVELDEILKEIKDTIEKMRNQIPEIEIY